MAFSNGTLHTFPRLAGASNYASWATNIKFVLMDKDLWAVVSGTSPRPVTSLDGINDLDSKSSPAYIAWTRENDQACATIGLSCLDGPKKVIQDLSARQMWLKLKELYEVRGFNARSLTFTTLLTHHYDTSKSIEQYVNQLKTSSRRLKEMDPTFPDWVIITVLLNNLGPTFNAFVTAKRQSIRVTTPSFDALAAELIDEARIEDNRGSMAMVFRGKNSNPNTKPKSLLQCTHCEKTGHEEHNCFLKYPHKKREFEAAKADKQKGNRSGNKPGNKPRSSSPSSKP